MRFGILTCIETQNRPHHPFRDGIEVAFHHFPEKGHSFLFIYGYTTEVQSVKNQGDLICFRTKNSTYTLEIRKESDVPASSPQ